MPGDINKRDFNYSISRVPRARWNILDLIEIMNKRAVPTLLIGEIDMTWAEDLRRRLKVFGDEKITVTAILLKAIAVAQRSHPETRTFWIPWGRRVTLRDIVAGFTVERFVDSQPVVFFGSITAADTKSIGQIAAEVRGYAEKDFQEIDQLDIQDRLSKLPWIMRQIIFFMAHHFPSIKLKFQSVTFGLTNLGKYGVKVLVPPCATTSVFGIGKVEECAVVRDGEIQIRPMMTVVYNFDHRILDGAPAARFFGEFQRLMEGGLDEFLTGN